MMQDSRNTETFDFGSIPVAQMKLRTPAPTAVPFWSGKTNKSGRTEKPLCIAGIESITLQSLIDSETIQSSVLRALTYSGAVLQIGVDFIISE